MRSTSVACHTQYLSYVEHKRTTKGKKMRRKQIHLLIMWNILVLIANNHCCRRQKHHQHYRRADFSIQYFHFVFPVVPCKCYVICTLSLSPSSSSSSLTALTSFSALVDVIYSLISFHTLRLFTSLARTTLIIITNIVHFTIFRSEALERMRVFAIMAD